MAAPSVHVKEGKRCETCKKEFNKGSFTINRSYKEKGFIIKQLTCGECYLGGGVTWTGINLSYL